MDTLTNKCPKCGKEMREGDAVCGSCGKRLTPKIGGAWWRIAAWPVATLLLFFLYPPRLDEDFVPAIFYMLALCIGSIAAFTIIRTWHRADVGSPERQQIMGPALSLLLVFFTIVNTAVDTSGSGYRMKSMNAMALSDLRNAKAALETYYVVKRFYPKNLAETEFKSYSNDGNYVRVDIVYSRTAPDKYHLTSSHKSGNEEYMCSSDAPIIYQRHKKEPDEQWRPM